MPARALELVVYRTFDAIEVYGNATIQNRTWALDRFLVGIGHSTSCRSPLAMSMRRWISSTSPDQPRPHDRPLCPGRSSSLDLLGQHDAGLPGRLTVSAVFHRIASAVNGKSGLIWEDRFG